MSSSSLLLHSLQPYLNNQSRLQPIIGLCSVTECVQAATGGSVVLYLCEACACRVGKADIRSHIMGSLHRCNYIKVWHPYVMGGWEVTDLSKLAWPLMEMARVLEKREGPGDVQVMEVDSAAYQMMASLGEAEAICFLHAVKDGRWAQLHSSVQSAHSLTALTQSRAPSVDFAQSQTPSVDFAQSQTPSVDFAQSQALSVDFAQWQTPSVDFAQTRRPSAEIDTPSAPPPARMTAAAGCEWQEPSIDFTQSSQRRSVEMDRPPAPPPTWMSPAAAEWRLEDSVVLAGACQTPLDPPAGQSQHSDVFLDGYTDSEPIIGLERVVECRGEEDGHSHCFLCHCCRVRTPHDGITHHLTSSSHYYNYMVETQPECEAAMRNCDRQRLLFTAHRAEERDGRGRVKVKWLPTSLCVQLTVNSYHWCIKTLGEGDAWTPADKQKTRWSLQGPGGGAAEASGTGGTREQRAGPAEPPRHGRKRKNDKDPVFKVSLPLNYGPLVLERTSFSLDALPVLLPPRAHPDPDPDPDPASATPSPSPEPRPPGGDREEEEFTFGDLCEEDSADALAEERPDFSGANAEALDAEERESQSELFGADPDTLPEEEEDQRQSQEWDSWDAWGRQEAREVGGYSADGRYRGGGPRNPAEESRRINVWLV